MFVTNLRGNPGEFLSSVLGRDGFDFLLFVVLGGGSEMVVIALSYSWWVCQPLSWYSLSCHDQLIIGKQ